MRAWTSGESATAAGAVAGGAAGMDGEPRQTPETMRVGMSPDIRALYQNLVRTRFCLMDRRRPEIRSGARQARRRDDAVSAAIQRVEADAASRDAGRIEARRIRHS
jgi:hypothetical protein